ncbi:MAG: adenylosuccinate synthase [Saprospiraceae bacterium]|nr:adenylosuccinate synthase [Bacteroidia bacterium]NNE16316.1 adenylosuccinate synthase [Saprospiraceae bacterium]NNL91372.1 adenylosuccinate synthase [Saprospiraceae bacterium]
MPIDVLLGLQWGDEGKGKIVDYLANNYDIIARFQGGPNAGHTIVIGDQKHVLHTIPSGVFRSEVINVIGNGVVIDPIVLARELNELQALGVDTSNIYIARKAHLILPTHRYLDAASEASKGKQKIGSTLRGIGPTYMDKTGRNGLRIGDLEHPNFKSKYTSLKEKHLQLGKIYADVDFDFEAEEKQWFDCLEKVKELKFIDNSYFINNALKEGKTILAEGAQGSMLDIDYGTYPFVTSSNTLTAGVCVGLGVSPKTIGKIFGITKSYCTRVGSGPFPTELDNEVGEELRKIGNEFGATTGRPRRTGWIDLPQLKYTIMLNGVDHLCITKMDCLNTFENIEMATHYNYDGNRTQELPYDLASDKLKPEYQSIPGWNEDICSIKDYASLPVKVKDYVQFLEDYLEVKVTMLSTGPERDSLIIKD